MYETACICGQQRYTWFTSQTKMVRSLSCSNSSYISIWSRHTTWDETLELWEGQINTSSPSLRFLRAHGLLCAAIVWLQTGWTPCRAAQTCLLQYRR